MSRPAPSTALAGPAHFVGPTHSAALPSPLASPYLSFPSPRLPSLTLKSRMIHFLLQGPPMRHHLLAERLVDRGGPRGLPDHARDLPHRALARLRARAREAAGTTLQEAQPGPGTLRSCSAGQDVPCHVRTPVPIKDAKTAREFSASLSYLPGVWDLHS